MAEADKNRTRSANWFFGAPAAPANLPPPGTTTPFPAQGLPLSALQALAARLKALQPRQPTTVESPVQTIGIRG
jgi:hypothetical protein